MDIRLTQTHAFFWQSFIIFRSVNNFTKKIFNDILMHMSSAYVHVKRLAGIFCRLVQPTTQQMIEQM